MNDCASDAHYKSLISESGLAHRFSLRKDGESDHMAAMSTHVPSLQAIRAKKSELLSIAAKHEALADKARKQAADFEAAERVWLQLSPESEPGGEMIDEGRALAGGTSRKPSDVPPVPEMIIEALQNAAESGAPGLTPTGLLSYVRQKYWPDAQNADVGSTAWRMWKDGRLIKPSQDSPIYALPGGKVSHPDLLEAGQDTRSGMV
jgi:hypothetical protein